MLPGPLRLIPPQSPGDGFAKFEVNTIGDPEFPMAKRTPLAVMEHVVLNRTVVPG